MATTKTAAKKAIVKKADPKCFTVKSPSPTIEEGSGEKIFKKAYNVCFNLELDEYDMQVLYTLGEGGDVSKWYMGGEPSIYHHQKMTKENSDPNQYEGMLSDVARLLAFGMIVEKNEGTDQKGNPIIRYKLTPFGKQFYKEYKSLKS